MQALGADGLVRTYGYYPPDFVEPYVMDYRQLDPDQLRQYLTISTQTRPGWTHPFDLSSLPDSRNIVDKKQIWEPADLDTIRQKLQARSLDAAQTSPRVPMERRATAMSCWEIMCFYIRDCTQDNRALCDWCRENWCERYRPILPKPPPGSWREIKRDSAQGHEEMDEGRMSPSNN
jgi:hypothetical protein